MKMISKEVSQAEPEYMNMHPPPPPPPISALATALRRGLHNLVNNVSQHSSHIQT